jgi:hypothetical protein
MTFDARRFLCALCAGDAGPAQAPNISTSTALVPGKRKASAEPDEPRDTARSKRARPNSLSPKPNPVLVQMPPEWVPPIAGVARVLSFPCAGDLTVRELVQLIREQLHDLFQLDVSGMLVNVFTDDRVMLTGIRKCPCLPLVLRVCSPPRAIAIGKHPLLRLNRHFICLRAVQVYLFTLCGRRTHPHRRLDARRCRG